MPARVSPELDPSSFEPSGVDPSSFDPSSFDPSGVDPSGVDPSGVDRSSFDQSGVDRSGVDQSSLEPSLVAESVETDRVASGFLLPTLAFGALVVAALQTLVIPITHDIALRLGASASSVSWVVTANLLAAAVLTPLLGRLGDLRGRRTVLAGILAAVLVGSLLAATTTSLPLLIFGRVLQGASYGIFPLAIGVLRDELEPRRLTGSMAIVSGSLAVGGGLALVATGLLTNNGGDYHRVFWLASALSAIGLALAWRFVPRRAPHAAGRVDWLGGAVLGVALVSLLLPLSQGNDWGWTSPKTLGLLVLSAIVFTGFWMLERRVAQPLVSTAMLGRRTILITNVAGLFLGVSMFVGFLGVAAFVQTPARVAGYGFGSSILAASVVYLLPGALAGVLTAPLGGRLVSRFGGKATLVLSMLMSAAGFGFIAVLHSSSWQVIAAAFITNTAVTFGYAAMPVLLVEQVSPAETGIANSVNSIARSLGSSLASALVVTLLTSNLIAGASIAVPHEVQYVLAFAAASVGALVGAGLVAWGLPPRPASHLSVLQAEDELVIALAGSDPNGR